ncbi:RepB family protein [Klebsiella pneumoniae]|uniref:RepB family protein n=1 Tax=Klebsiella pneumoniae TaxID=573 RepID=UPI00388F16B1
MSQTENAVTSSSRRKTSIQKGGIRFLMQRNKDYPVARKRASFKEVKKVFLEPKYKASSCKCVMKMV